MLSWMLKFLYPRYRTDIRLFGTVMYNIMNAKREMEDHTCFLVEDNQQYINSIQKEVSVTLCARQEAGGIFPRCLPTQMQDLCMKLTITSCSFQS